MIPALPKPTFPKSSPPKPTPLKPTPRSIGPTTPPNPSPVPTRSFDVTTVPPKKKRKISLTYNLHFKCKKNQNLYFYYNFISLKII